MARGDISKIITALNKLEEEAAKDTAVLRRSLRHSALKAAREKTTEVTTTTTTTNSNISNPDPDDENTDKMPKESGPSHPECDQTEVGNVSLTTKYLQTLATLARKSKNDENVSLNKLLADQKGAKLFLNSIRKKSKCSSHDEICKVEEVSKAKVHPELDKGDDFEDRPELRRENGKKFIKSDDDDDCLVKAKPAIVLEDQVDSLTYYDQVEVERLGEDRKVGGGLYESIAGSLLNLAMTKEEQQEQKELDELYSNCKREEGDQLQLDPSEALSYSLAKLSRANDKNVNATFLRMSSVRNSDSSSSNFCSSSGSEIRASTTVSSTSDDNNWIDIDEEYEVAGEKFITSPSSTQPFLR